MNSGFLLAAFGLLVLADQLHAALYDTPETLGLRRVRSCNMKLKRFGLRDTDDLFETRVKIDNMKRELYDYGDSKNHQPVFQILSMWENIDSWNGKSCEKETPALFYNRIIQQHAAELSPAFCQWSKVGTEKYTAGCYEYLSADNWAGFEKALLHQNVKAAADYVDELMGDNFAGKETFDDLNSFDRFAKLILATKKAKRSLKSAKRAINDLVAAVDFLFDNINFSDPAHRMTTRIKNFYIARLLWKRAKLARDDEFHDFMEHRLSDTNKVMLSCVSGAPSVAAGIESCATKYSISKDEVRTKLQDTCKSVKSDANALIDFIHQLQLSTDTHKVRGVKVCTVFNSGDSVRQLQPLFAEQSN